MGRHLWRLVKPQFLWKMLRSNAASLYGWDILLAGTAWPGKEIGHANADIIREAAKYHEVGLHAWDHHAWQAHSGNWDRQTMVDDIARGLRTGRDYRPTNNLLRCRWLACRPTGDRSKRRVPFALQQRLSWGDAVSSLARLRKTRHCANPGDLTHRDEVIGRDVKAEDFNGWLLNRILRDKGTPVYTIHAEVEGCAYQHNFVDLLKRAAQEGVTFCPLSELLSGMLPLGQVVRGNIAGREGWLGCQQIAGSR